MKAFKPTQEQIDSVARKLDIVMNLAGEGDEQINVLVHALANAVIDQELEMASAINALTAVYISGMDARYSTEEDDYDE